MKKIIFTTCFIIWSLLAFAQDTGNDSYTIQRLIIYNSKGEILLEKHQNGWMTPALRHNSKVSINEGLNNLASQFGLKITTPQLAGIFMFISEYKLQSSFRQHFTSYVTEGALKLPNGRLDVQWFPPHKVIEMMSLPDAKLIFAVRDMIKQMLEYPKIVWGGVFLLWKEHEKVQYKVTENFYPISKRN